MFSTTQDFQQYLPVSNAFSLAQAERYIKNAIRDEIAPAISKAQLDDLLTATTLSEIQQQVLDLLKEATANFALRAYLPFISVHISDAGLHRTETDKIQPLFLRQEQELRTTTFANATKALNLALQTMQNNDTEFENYINKIYKVQAKNFLQNAAQLAQYLAIENPYCLFARIQKIISQQEEIYLQNILGEQLFAELKEKLRTAAALTADEKNLQTYCIAFIANKIIAINYHLLPITYQNGLVTISQNTENQKTQTPDNTLQNFLNQIEKNAETRQKLLTDYLQKNNTIFTLYQQSKHYVPPETTPKANNTKENTTFWF